MNLSVGLSALFPFTVSLIVGVLLNGIKTTLGFYQKQDLDLLLAEKDAGFQKWIREAESIWVKPGFFESLSLGRFLSDAVSLFSGAVLFSGIFSLNWGAAFAVAGVLVYLFSHWGSSVLAKAYAPYLGGVAIHLYRLYAWLLMGKIGHAIFQLNEWLLHRLGRESRLSFLGKEDSSHPDQEGENPDRSGLEEEEKEMIRSIFDLRETQAKEVMTPRGDIVALEIGAGYREVMDLITHEKFSRIPVYSEDLNHVKGVLHVMSLMGLPEEGLRENFRLSDYIREAYFVPRTKKIGELMREFRQKQVHMAVVVDEYGGTSGIITLEDILEEIVGEIHDEDEVETRRVQREGEGVYRIDPVVSLFDLKKELGIDLRPDGEEDVHVDTVGGFILYVHGRVPAQGDVVRHENLEFEILEMDGNKIEDVRLTVGGGTEEPVPAESEKQKADARS